MVFWGKIVVDSVLSRILQPTDLRVFCANFLGWKMRLCYFSRFLHVWGNQHRSLQYDLNYFWRGFTEQIIQIRGITQIFKIEIKWENFVWKASGRWKLIYSILSLFIEHCSLLIKYAGSYPLLLPPSDDWSCWSGPPITHLAKGDCARDCRRYL